MSKPTIAFINHSTLLKDVNFQRIFRALQIQVTRDFAPVWGQDATLVVVGKGQVPPKGAWQLVFLDHSDQAGALGYHDFTSEGLPIGKVFVADDLRNGLHVSVTASHEILEMLGDPDIARSVYVGTTAGDLFYALEVSDACEDDQYGYKIRDVVVSDFVYPAWFEPTRTNTQFDYMNKITAPLQLLPGGYIGVYKPGSGWNQVTPNGEQASYKSRGHVGSRRERRRTPKDQWVESKI